MAEEDTAIDLSQYYSASAAAKALSKKSGKTINPAYVRNLARYGVFHPIKFNERYNLYLKTEVDAYVVEDRGRKVARSQKTRVRKEKSVA